MRYCDRTLEDGYICGETIPVTRQHHWCADCHAEYMRDYRKKHGNETKRPGRKGPATKFEFK